MLVELRSCLENEVGLIASAHFDILQASCTFRIWPQRDTDGMMEGLTELCIGLQDMPHSYVAHQSEFSED